MLKFFPSGLWREQTLINLYIHYTLKRTQFTHFYLQTHVSRGKIDIAQLRHGVIFFA
jgi:hypothetical protein